MSLCTQTMCAENQCILYVNLFDLRIQLYQLDFMAKTRELLVIIACPVKMCKCMLYARITLEPCHQGASLKFSHGQRETERGRLINRVHLLITILCAQASQRAL